MPSKCSREERAGFSNRSSVEAVVSGRLCVFLCESKSTLFGRPTVDAIRNHSDYLQQNSNAFHGRPFREPRRRGNSDFDMIISGVVSSVCASCVCVCERERESQRRVVCVCVCLRERERERESHSCSIVCVCVWGGFMRTQICIMTWV